MDFYDFNKEVYKKILELFKFRFYKQIKNTGIVFKEIIEAKKLINQDNYYVIICEDDSVTHQIKFVSLKILILN